MVLKEARFGFQIAVVGEVGFGLVGSFGVAGHVGIEVDSVFLPILLFFLRPEPLSSEDVLIPNLSFGVNDY